MFRIFALAAALAAFGAAALGSWIRINQAGMTCPDWPLCNGAIVPALGGGVVLEWGHRMIVAFESVLMVAALVAAWQQRKRIAGIGRTAAFIVSAYCVQVILGAATVALSNSPWSVVWHWGAAMAFLAGLSVLVILAFVEPARKAVPAVQNGLYPLLATCAAVAFVTMCAGAYVSSSGAGLACLSLPYCNGTLFGHTPAQLAQMVHRLFAGLFFVFATIAVYRVTVSAPLRVRAATLAGYTLIVAQILLGFANVAYLLPPALRELHAANAGLTFIAFVCAFAFATIDGTVAVASAAHRSSPSMTAGAR
jgi:heme A synthase